MLLAESDFIHTLWNFLIFSISWNKFFKNNKCDKAEKINLFTQNDLEKLKKILQ